MFDIVNALSAALAVVAAPQTPAVPPRADTLRLSAAVATARDSRDLRSGPSLGS